MTKWYLLFLLINLSLINNIIKLEPNLYDNNYKKKVLEFLYGYEGIEEESDTNTVYEINKIYDEQPNYVYEYIEATSSKPSLYFSFLPSEIFNVSIGSFSLELDTSVEGNFTGVACTFVDNDTNSTSMIEKVEEANKTGTSYCIGSQSTVNPRRYNYIFKYEYEDEITPKKMVIKVSNGNSINANFTIFMRKEQGITIERTDFEALKEYGKEEENAKSLVPYIIDVYNFRGDDNYVSKILFYSQYLEMQMYYIPEDSNKPTKLFSGNILLVYTKPELVIQKYHATTLILFSEKLEGQEHSSLDHSFRFHTKMFKSEEQVELFVSQNMEGRTLNFPLSIQKNTCTSDNNKLYYILNYNKGESNILLYLDMVFGSYLKARIANKINYERWDLLIKNMVDITDYQFQLDEQTQHIDVIEITCNTPFLLNIYYSNESYQYNNVKEGKIVFKNLAEKESFSFYIENSTSLFFYTMSLFNPRETPSVIVQYSDEIQYNITENSLKTGMLLPEKITVINNSKSKTKFIFKNGYAVDTSEDWNIVEEAENLEGTLFTSLNKYVYKFPDEENKLNFTSVTFTINSVNDKENVKFCYSTNLGLAIPSSRENCFRTGKNIPYKMTFLNPLILGKNYKVDTEKYFISFTPFNDEDFINIEITENKYNNLNRNEEGVSNLLTLIEGKTDTILSLPKNHESSKIFIQMNTCKSLSEPINYTIYDALTKEVLNVGQISQKEAYGIYYIAENTYLEKELFLEGESGITIYSKHSGIDNYYSPTFTSYEVTFDSATNVATIKKPILDEEFIITVLVGEKGSLSSLTQCDLAFKNKTTLAPYVSSFISASNNITTHYIDFSNTLNYEVGKEFDLLVYAEQTNNYKMEVLYPIIIGTVGKITEFEEITEYIEGESEYVYKIFSSISSGNYLYYDFINKPIGNVASLRIYTNSAKVNKVWCVFVSNSSTNEEMIIEVNKAVLEETSFCIGEIQEYGYEYNALINANYKEGNNRLLIKVMYGEEEELKVEEDEITINLKITGTKFGKNEGKFGINEKYSTIPYVLDLLEIRNSKEEYISKILLYSNTREMEMFYIDINESTPVSLFTGNIMLVYTNEELVYQKYHGATTMILISDALSSIDRTIIGEQYRFMVKFFNSAANINYFLSSNPEGRPLNSQTTIEMTSCSQPYYYIMNYNKVEEQRKLHIDTIFGEKQSIKMVSSLNYDDWDKLISNMEELDGDEIILNQSKYHFDVIEVKCNLPLLLNLFYVDPTSTKVTDLELGDILILSLEKGQEQQLEFKQGQNQIYVYNFNIFKEKNQKPNIEIIFNGGESLEINENGVYTKYFLTEMPKILIKNKENSGNINTRIIFKYGQPIEQTFEKIQNGIYSNLNDKSRTDNLFSYIYDQTSSKLNFKGVDFEVQTTEDNVKFCYNTNLGTFLIPSLQNCYIVGKKNPYTISTLNPLVMYRDYYSEEHMNYYVGFRTVDINQNITIVPKSIRYDTTERIFEGVKNKIIINNEQQSSTILTTPKNHETYLFTHIHVCTKNNIISYEFLNGYNSSNLGFNGEIQPNSKYQFISVDNTKLDTELKLKGDNGVEVFVKYVGLSFRYQPLINDIMINYDYTTRILSWNQPINEEEFEYNIYIDKLNVLKNSEYTLCSVVDKSKLAYYHEVIKSENNIIKFIVPNIGKEYEEFDAIIIAEQVNNGKITILSDVYQYEYIEPIEEEEEEFEENEEEGEEEEHREEDDDKDRKEKQKDNKNNTTLIVVLSVVGFLVIVGVVVLIVYFLKCKKNGGENKSNKRPTVEMVKSSKNDEFTGSEVRDTNPLDE